MQHFLKFLFVISIVLIFSTYRSHAQCVISNLQVQTANCVDNNHYSFTLNFFISDSPSEFFDVFVNGAFHSTHSLNERPLTITNFEGNSSGVDTLTVCASGSSECCASKIMQSPCPCSYFNIDWTTVNCTEDSLWFELDFDYINVQDSFHVGSVGNYLGKYSIVDLPVLLGPIARSALPREVLISDPDFFCFGYFELTDDFCDECLIHQVNAIAGECNEDGFFPISIEFLNRNTGTAGFTIQGNGTNYGTFNYSTNETADNGMYIQTVDLGFLPGDCETVWEFVVSDIEDESCNAFTVLQPVCCPNDQCEVGALSVTGIECTSVETIQFELDFEYQNPGNELFDLYLNDFLVGTYPLSSLPLFIGELQFYPNDENILTVCINDQPDCCSSFTFENLDCFEEFCELGEVEHTIVFVNQEIFYVQIDFDHNNTGNQGFNIRGNGKNYGIFFYENLPVLVGPFNCKENIPLEFSIRDVQFENCRTVLELGTVPCETSTDNQDIEEVSVYYSNGKNTLVVMDKSEELLHPTFSIFNVLGQKITVFSTENAGNSYQLFTGTIEPGIYFLNMQENGRTHTLKFIVAE